MHKIYDLGRMFFVIAALFLLAAPAGAQTEQYEVRPIAFPMIGQASFSNSFGDPRSGGRSHAGVDIFAAKMRPLIAVTDGTIVRVNYPEAEWGYAVIIRDRDGYQYWYLHMNNDNPGTDDGQGGGLNAYAIDIINGNPVVKGQLIGWVGDSGNAETTPPHLHFEIHRPDGTVINPYESLRQAERLPAIVTNYPALPNEILPFGEFKGGASLATGNFGSDASLVVGAGPGGGPHVKIMTRSGRVVHELFAYPLAFRGGVNVAAGDLDGDGIDEIITGAGPGGGPHVRIFKADGRAVGGFFAYADTFRGGVDVAAKPASANSPARIVTSPLAGGGPHIRTFDASGQPEASFFAYADDFRGGVKVAVNNFNPATGSYQIVTVPASKGGPDIRFFSSSGSPLGSRSAFEPWWRGGYEVAAGPGNEILVTANMRRASIRTVSSISSSPSSGGGSFRDGWGELFNRWRGGD